MSELDMAARQLLLVSSSGRVRALLLSGEPMTDAQAEAWTAGGCARRVRDAEAIAATWANEGAGPVAVVEVCSRPERVLHGGRSAARRYRAAAWCNVLAVVEVGCAAADGDDDEARITA